MDAGYTERRLCPLISAVHGAASSEGGGGVLGELQRREEEEVERSKNSQSCKDAAQQEHLLDSAPAPSTSDTLITPRARSQVSGEQPHLCS